MKRAKFMRAYSLNFILSFFIVLSAGGVLKAADGSSGCGPAWYILSENSILSSALRAVTNGMFTPVVTLGMTFGTSNCSSHKLVQERPEALELATLAYHSLLTQTAQGAGQHLAAFSGALGCSWSRQDEFNRVLQNNYERIFSSDEVAPAQLVLSTIESLQAHPGLARDCGLTQG
ncbi:MAG: DUF3015 family protein [Oligoflexales bacterium]|nr:DUF3015 family protein [Oligoflexales bacterium]